MAIHVSGSIAFDRIMFFPGQFEDHLLPDKLHMINVGFLIDRIEEKHGGTAANIGYNLVLLGEKPYIYGAVGRDFEGEFKQSLTKMGMNLAGVQIFKESLTACAYITTDNKGNQITGFNPAALAHATKKEDFPKCNEKDLAVIAPGNMDDMIAFAKHYKANKTPYIYDPGQQIPALSAEMHLDCIEGAEILIGNDYELELITKITKHSKAELLEKAKFVITTLGENGCEIARGMDKMNIVAPKVGEVADPTGAGDSFRAGLLHAMTKGLDIAEAAKLGSVCSAFCIEKYGTQEHFYDRELLKARYEESYGTFPL